jgi:hypothetical protein
MSSDNVPTSDNAPALIDNSKSVFDKMGSSTNELVLLVRRYHGEYFMCGIFLGVTKPSFGWVLLGLSSCIPTLMILKHPEWVMRFKDEKMEHLLLLLLLVAASEVFALHCFGNSLGFKLSG